MKRLARALAALGLAALLAACNAADLPAESTSLPLPEPDVATGGRGSGEHRQRIVSEGAGLGESVAVGAAGTLYRVVQDAEAGGAYFLVTDYDTLETDWLRDSAGECIFLPAEGDVRLLAVDSTVYAFKMGLYGLTGEAEACAIYRLWPEGFELLWEFARGEEFHPEAVVIYDGEGFYLDVVHTNGAKGTRELVMLYLYEDMSNITYMKYYPYETDEPPPLLAGHEDYATLILAYEGEHYRYNWSHGVMEETPAELPDNGAKAGSRDAWGRRLNVTGEALYAVSDTYYFVLTHNGDFGALSVEEYWRDDCIVGGILLTEPEDMERE